MRADHEGEVNGEVEARTLSGADDRAFGSRPFFSHAEHKAVDRSLLTIGEAARRLNVKERFIRHLIAGGRIDVIKIGRLVRIPAEAVDDLKAAGYRPAASE